MEAAFGVKTLREQKFQEISITSQFSHYSIRKSKVFEISCNFLKFLFPQSFYLNLNTYNQTRNFSTQANEASIEATQASIEATQAMKPKLTVRAVLLDAIRQRGVLSLWTGFVPYLMRCGPHAVITLMLSEELTAAYKMRKSYNQ